MSQSLLLKIVRESITEVFEAKRIINKQELLQEYPVLAEPLSSFVNIYINKELRGSSGSVQASDSLLENIILNAKKAAFEDPRFSPLKVSEYIRAEVELSLLTPCEELKYGSIEDLQKQVQPFEDGLIVSLDSKEAAFLPQDWSSFPEFTEYLNALLKQANIKDINVKPKIFSFQVETSVDAPIIKD